MLHEGVPHELETPRVHTSRLFEEGSVMAGDIALSLLESADEDGTAEDWYEFSGAIGLRADGRRRAGDNDDERTDDDLDDDDEDLDDEDLDDDFDDDFDDDDEDVDDGFDDDLSEDDDL